MPIVTYSKYSKKEERNVNYLRWQGYESGKKIQKHIGKAGDPKAEKCAIEMDIKYLKELIERTKDELYLREQQLKNHEARIHDEFSIRNDRIESIPSDRKTSEEIFEVKSERVITDEEILAQWKPPVKNPEVKIQAFRLYENRTSLEAINQQLGIKPRTLQHWEKKFKQILQN